MTERKSAIIDGNEAAAYIAHLTNEVIAIYPITPASPMGEWADEWSARQIPNLWDTIPDVIEMQSEAGAAGAMHGALQAGSLTTTFTASQGLLLMIPNMYKIAGELTPTVLHVSARSLAAQALSIFGDHSDVMSCRATGYAMLCSNSVQEVMDFSLLSQAATLKGRIPFLHFFDGFRTSHEVSKVDRISHDQAREIIDEELVNAHRSRALSPDHPVIRGTSQNPDVYFQGRETVNPYYDQLPAIVQDYMDQFARLTGRQYRLFDYMGAEDAKHVICLMGSGAGAAEETVEELVAQGMSVGLVKVRLYRPFDSEALLKAIPDTVQRIAVLDRCKEPGADGEPLYKDVLSAYATAFAEERINFMPRVLGGRYGLSSKEFTPAMVAGIFKELVEPHPRNHFTVGIHDDVGNTSLGWDPEFRPGAASEMESAVFYGLGSDGTVSANKNSIKIIGQETDNFVQGYFQYDSKKAGAVTVSHLRFGPKPIRSTYLVGEAEANFVACHQPVFLNTYEMLDKAAQGAHFLINTATPPERVWNDLTRGMQQQILSKQLKLHVIDAYGLAQEVGMGRRINTIMQTCFFSISALIDTELAVQKIKAAVEATYGRKGQRLVEKNFAAIDGSLERLHKVPLPTHVTSNFDKPAVVSPRAPEFIQNITAQIIAGRGDDLKVSQIPDDGTWPLGTAAWEKRDLARELPKWEPDICTHCGKCPLVCPHAAIRSKLFREELTVEAPGSFQHVQIKGKDFDKGWHISYQVAPEDCTGCGLCVEICPIKDKKNPGRKALNMTPDPEFKKQEVPNWEFFLGLPEYDRTSIKINTLKGSMIMQPLFEFSGACVGCGETPYIKLATQLFGDRMVIANATGCSSIYGGNLPTTPYTTDPNGRGPAWSNSLFEDNAEFGLGMRLAIDKQMAHARELLGEVSGQVGDELVKELLNAQQITEADIHEQRQRVEQLKGKLEKMEIPQARNLTALADTLVKKSVWSIGGDGWAYDIGYGGLDHALTSGRDINLLVLDTEVYSNTGGQTSKATPLGAVAKFSAAGKSVQKKDLAMMAMAYGDVYVAQIAFGAKDVQTLRTFIEAESFPGPSLIIAYCPCIAHGIDLANNLRQQELAVNSGHWPLFRFDPRKAREGENPLHMDSKEPSIPYRDFVTTETRFSVLMRTHPEEAERFLQAAQRGVKDKFKMYEQLAHLAIDDKQ
ncbi:MAG: pyruvate:ferredoxin (flavodoxin) oxidoreductase [Candidatus Sedimenticola sp. 20ELBAFRAG]